MHDGLDVRFLISSLPQEGRDFLQVGYGVQVTRALFPSEAPVEVAPDGRVPRVAGQLANAVDVVGYSLESYQRVRRLAGDISWVEHPGIESRADDRVPFDQTADLFVRQLTVVGDKGAAVMVARQDGPAK